MALMQVSTDRRGVLSTPLVTYYGMLISTAATKSQYPGSVSDGSMS